MLVLTRRIGEEIVIAGDIRVTVVAIDGQKVRLGITAAPTIHIDRAEIAALRKVKTISTGNPPEPVEKT